MVDPDAIAEYVNSLRPSMRLKYYRLTKGERLTVEAMLNCTRGTGMRVFAHIEKLAELAGVNEKTVRNAIHGYTKKGNKRPGLLSRGILSQISPADRGDRLAAAYRVNWQAFTLDPRQLRALEKRLRRLEKKRLQANLFEADSEEPSFPQKNQNPTAFAPPSSATVAGDIGNSCRSEGKRLPVSSATVSPVVEKLVVGLSSSLQKDRFSPESDERIAEIIARSAETAVFSPTKEKTKPHSAKPKSSWDTLHPGIQLRIQKQLQLIHGAVLRSPSPWPAGYCPSAHEYARQKAGEMRVACDRAEIWDHVKEDLVQEVYDRIIASRMPKGET